MAMHVLRPIVKNIKNSSDFSLMAGEKTDIINKEQFVICIHWIDNDLNENEDFIESHELNVTSSETLTFILNDIVLRLRIDPERLGGQCHDGCSKMMGSKSRVATTIKKELNRVVQKVVQQVCESLFLRKLLVLNPPILLKGHLNTSVLL